MKGWIVVLIVLGVWIAYKRDSTFASVVNAIVPLGNPGVVKSPLSRGYGSSVAATSRSGSTSPGSGKATIQPTLVSTYSVASSGAGAGFSGVAFPPQKASVSVGCY